MLVFIIAIVFPCFSQQKDSSVSVTPVAFDYFIVQDVKEHHYQKECDELIKDTINIHDQAVKWKGIADKNQGIIDNDQKAYSISNVQIQILTGQLAHANKIIGGLKIGCISISILGLASTIYFIIH